jgi:hypothetical protein
VGERNERVALRQLRVGAAEDGCPVARDVDVLQRAGEQGCALAAAGGAPVERLFGVEEQEEALLRVGVDAAIAVQDGAVGAEGREEAAEV